MKLKNPNLPYILAPVVYCLHLWLVMSCNYDPYRGWDLGFVLLLMVYAFVDALFGLLLLWLVLSGSFRWRTRTRSLTAFGLVIVVGWLTTVLRFDNDLQLSAFFGGQLLAWIVSTLTLRQHPYLREK